MKATIGTVSAGSDRINRVFFLHANTRAIVFTIAERFIAGGAPMFRWWILGLWLTIWPHAAVPHFVRSERAALWAQKERVSVKLAPLAVDPSGHPTQFPYLLASRTTNYFHAIPTQEKNIALVAQRLNGVVVKPGTVFSYYKVAGPYTAQNGYGWGRMFVGDRIVPSVGGGVCQGSSTLYSAILRTGLPVLERHRHGLTVPYLPPGEDATVASDYLNFRFRNNRATPILITALTKDRHLTVSVWGTSPGPEIVVKHQILEEYPFRVVEEVDPQLKPGETKVVAPGQKGVKVKSWLEEKTTQGVVMKPLGIDTYRPSPRVIRVGARP